MSDNRRQSPTKMVNSSHCVTSQHAVASAKSVLILYDLQISGSVHVIYDAEAYSYNHQASPKANVLRNLFLAAFVIVLRNIINYVIYSCQSRIGLTFCGHLLQILPHKIISGKHNNEHLHFTP